MEPKTITVKGAREHNLQSVSIELPRNKLICFTGVSGSGKSSLAFDTLYAEGQRRYIESLSSYARQFLGQLPKPDADLITGLSPSISIQQKTSGWNPRSTVGTITQIHDYLRVLFARVGTQHCTQCGREITAQTREQIVERILELPAGTRLHVLAPVVRGQKGEYRDLFEDMRKRGYLRARVNGQLCELSDTPALKRNQKHFIEIVVDRLALNPSARARLAESVDNALALGDGTMMVLMADKEAEEPSAGKRRSAERTGAPEASQPSEMLLSSRYACTHCNLSYEPPSPQMFSFNSPAGMCMTCDGLGHKFDFDPQLLVPDPKLSFYDLAIEPMRTSVGRWRKHIYEAVAAHVGCDLSKPWDRMSDKAKKAVLFGTGDTHLTFEWRWRGGVWRHGGTFAGIVAELNEKYKKAKSSAVRKYYEKYMRETICPACQGARLNPQALAVRLGGRNLTEVESLPIDGAAEFFDRLALTSIQQYIAAEVLKEIRSRLKFLHDVGLDYLTLNRSAPTLSGGESQRIRLASQIGSGLVGVLYILDEPSIGLHPRDNRRLLESLLRLRDMGNTVIVVEHDEETMCAADLIVDFGPGPGVRGGHVVAAGTLNQIKRAKGSITGAFLKRKERIEIPKQRRPVQSPPKRTATRSDAE